MSERAKRIAKGLGGRAIPDRWMAEITYLDDRNAKVIVFEELYQIDEHVERGPDWNTIDRIVITLNRPTLKPKTREGKP